MNAKPLTIQLIRHATLRVNIDELTLLVDPMLGDTGSMPPIDNTANQRPNPLVPLPVSGEELLAGVNAVLVTHTHRDHWDAAASETIPHSMPILCQPEDMKFFQSLGFEDVRPVHSAVAYGMVTIARVPAQHGTGEIANRMAPVCGYLLRSRGGDSLYIAGDTVLYGEVRKTLEKYRPQVTVLNCGGARFLEGDPITMTAEEVAEVAQSAPYTTVIAVHMEAINHCGVTRTDVRRVAGTSVMVPADGDVLTLTEVATADRNKA